MAELHKITVSSRERSRACNNCLTLISKGKHSQKHLFKGTYRLGVNE